MFSTVLKLADSNLVDNHSHLDLNNRHLPRKHDVRLHLPPNYR